MFGIVAPLIVHPTLIVHVNNKRCDCNAHDDRCWSKILRSMIPNPVYDFKVKITDLEFLYCNFLQFQFFLKAFNGFY